MVNRCHTIFAFDVYWLSLQLRADPINISNLQFLLVSTRLIIEAAMYEENRIVM